MNFSLELYNNPHIAIEKVLLEPDRRRYRNVWVVFAQVHGKMGCLVIIYFRLIPILGQGGGGGGWICLAEFDQYWYPKVYLIMLALL